MQVQGEEYGDDELDPEWQALLSHLDERLQVGLGCQLGGEWAQFRTAALLPAGPSQAALARRRVSWSSLQAAGRPRLSTRERAVAIRSLIVATASQSADVALSKAMHDVEAYRQALVPVAVLLPGPTAAGCRMWGLALKRWHVVGCCAGGRSHSGLLHDKQHSVWWLH